MALRVLSIKQPWAHLIVSGQKLIENRTWTSDYRGTVLIHTGKRADLDSVEIENRYGIAIPRSLPTGGLVGIAEIVDAVSNLNAPVSVQKDKFFEGPYGFVLRNTQKLPFIHCRGKLGIYRLDPAIERRLRADPIWRDAILRRVPQIEMAL